MASNPLFPTFVRATVKDKPPYKPAGIEHCDEVALVRYRLDQYAYPPYQYQLQYMVRDAKGKIQPPTSEIEKCSWALSEITP